jgi:hypothetical protein
MVMPTRCIWVLPIRCVGILMIRCIGVLLIRRTVRLGMISMTPVAFRFLRLEYLEAFARRLHQIVVEHCLLVAIG